MAAPTVLSESWTTPSGSNSTTYAVTVPTGSAGDVVECEIGSTSNGDLSTTSTGWHLVRQWKFASGLSAALFRKKVGTAGADSLTVTSSVSARFNAHTARYPVGTRTYASPTLATATGTNSNPPQVDHMKASRDVLYAAMRVGAGTVVPSVAPTGYGTVQNNAGASGGVSLSYGRKTATSGSDDPGTFTSSSALWGCLTIARWIDTDGPSLNATKALLVAGTQDLVALAMGDSQEAGAVAIAGPTQTMGSNASAVCRNAIRATDLVAMPGSRACIGASGGQTAPADVKAWDTRLTADASFDLSDTIAAPTLGGYAWTLGTSGHKISLAMGEAFDRVEVCYFTAPASPQWTVDVNGGTAQTLTGMVAANGIAKTTLTLSGNSSAVINLTAPGAGGYVLYVRAYLTSTPRVHFLNMGSFGWTSTQLADASAYYSSRVAQRAVAADITFFTGGSNDTGAGIPFATTLDNLRLSILTGLATGEFCYTIPNYFEGGNEAAQDALWDQVADMCDELGAAVNRLTLKSGYTTSYAATVTAGNLITGNNHMTAQGHAVAGAHDVAMIEPPVASLTVNNAAHGQSATSPTLAAESTVAPNNTDHAHGATSPSLSASGPATVTPADAAHGHDAGSPALAAASTVAPSDTTHAQPATSPALATNTTAAPADTAHAQSATSPAISAGGGGTLWTPTELGSAVAGWWDAADATTLTLSSGNVSDWANKGAAGGSLAASGGAQPPYSATALNGLPGVTGAAGTHSMATGTLTGLPTGTDPAFTMFAVGKPDAASASLGAFVTFGANASEAMPMLGTLANGNFYIDCFGSGITTSVNVTGSGHILSVKHNTDTTTYSHVDGVASGQSSFSVAPGASPAAKIFDWFASGYPNGGILQEYIILSTVLSDADREILEGYAAWKWGLEGNLDAGHPYKSAAPTVAGGTPSVTPADSAHTQTAGQPSLAAASTVAPNNAAHAQSAASPTLAAKFTITPADSNHAHTVSEPTLSAASTVAPADSGHALASTDPTLAVNVTVSPANAEHGHTAGEPSVNVGGSVAVDGALHGHTVSSPALAFSTTVSPASAGHDHAANSPSLGFLASVSPNFAVHGHTASSPAITAYAAGAVSPDSASHAHSVTSPTLGADVAPIVLRRVGRVVISPRVGGANVFDRIGLSAARPRSTTSRG